MGEPVNLKTAETTASSKLVRHCSYKEVMLVGFDVPFIDLVILLVKISLAMIPAAVIVFVAYVVLILLMASVFGITLPFYYPFN